MKLACSAAVMAVALLVSGCGSSGTKSNGEASRTADQILADAEAAAAKATSVHVLGSGSRGRTLLGLDLYLVADKGARGHLNVNGLAFDIIRVGQTAYFKGDAKFWSALAGGVPVDQLKDRWLSAPSGAGDFAPFVSLTDISTLFTAFLGTHGTLTKGATSTIDGQPVIALMDASRQATLYVRASGPPYPIELVNSAKESKLTFEQWDEPFALAPPAKSSDFAKLKALVGG